MRTNPTNNVLGVSRSHRILHRLANPVVFALLSFLLLAAAFYVLRESALQHQLERQQMQDDREFEKLDAINREANRMLLGVSERLGLLKRQLRASEVLFDEREGYWRISEESAQELSEIFVDWITDSPQFLSLRLTTASGVQIVRVDNMAFLQPPAVLENSSAVANDQIFKHHLVTDTLNIDKGQFIYHQVQPLGTAASGSYGPETPVMLIRVLLKAGTDDHYVIEVITNQGPTLQRLADIADDTPRSNILVVRADGIFIFANDEEKKLVFEGFDSERPTSLRSLLPELWSATQKKVRGALVLENERYYFRRTQRDAITLDVAARKENSHHILITHRPEESLLIQPLIDHPLLLTVSWLFLLAVFGLLTTGWLLLKTYHAWVASRVMQVQTAKVVTRELRRPANDIEILSKQPSLQAKDIQRVNDHANRLIEAIDDLGYSIDSNTHVHSSSQTFRLANLLDSLEPELRSVVEVYECEFQLVLDTWSDDVYQGDVPRIRSLLRHLARGGVIDCPGCDIRCHIWRENMKVVDRVIFQFSRGHCDNTDTANNPQTDTGFGSRLTLPMKAELGVADRWAQQLGGEVKFVELAGRSTSVELSLNLPKVLSDYELKVSDPSHLISRLRGRQVLHVENDSEGRNATEVLLTNTLNMDVIWAPNTEQALAVLSERRVDLIVADLPHDDQANHFVETVRENDAATPIVLVTANPFDVDEGGNVDTWIAKPVSHQKFCDALSDLHAKGRFPGGS